MKDFMDFFNEILEEIKAEENFEKEVEEEMKTFNINGYYLFKEYEHNLLQYWKDGHGEMLVLVSEIQGFLDCLMKQNLIEEKNYMYLIDCFREKMRRIRSK